MITKFEAVGIFSSIAVMALALFLLRVDSATDVVSSVEGTNQQAQVVVVDQAGGQEARQAAIADALTAEDEQLIINDVKIGTGAVVEEGSVVRVNYIGRLQNGQEFDNSYKRGNPFEFRIGAGDVIAGWEEGIVGMRVGGERILVIPSDLAYGNRNVGPIPAGSTLIFAIELLEVN